MAILTLNHVPRDEHAELLNRIAVWLREGGFLLGSLGVDDGPDSIDDDWLGVPMFFSHFDAQTNRRLIAEAGHLPPLLTRGDGRTDVLDLPPGLPLGLGGEAFQPTQLSLPPGATLALYTDGLVESRSRPLDDGMAALAGALSGALAPDRPAALDTACAAVTSQLMQHGEDDITLVVVKTKK